MSRKARDIRLEASKRWPQLYQFLAGYCHQDWPEDYGTPEAAVDAAITDYTLAMRQQVLQEWRDWHASVEAVDDIRKIMNDGFGVNVWFKKPIDGRRFMDEVHDKLVISIKREIEERWKR